MAFLSREITTATGTTQVFSIPFNFISRSHVVVKVNGTETTDFTWNNDGQITIVTPTINAGDKVRRERRTSNDSRLVDFITSQNYTEADLDQSALQMFYLAQENIDDNSEHITKVTDESANWDVQSGRLTSVADPVDNQDAATKAYGEANWGGTAAASAAASAAAAAASAAAAAADAVLTAADVVSTNADVVSTNADAVSTAADAASTAADAIATAADAVSTAADVITAGNIVGAVAAPYVFNTSTTMADPTTGLFRLNSATPASVTAIAIDDATNASGNPDINAYLATWDDSTSTIKGHLTIVQEDDPTKFMVFAVTGLTDNAGWIELAVSHVAGTTLFGSAKACRLQFSRTGDKGTLDVTTKGDLQTYSTVATRLPVGTDGQVLLADSGETTGLRWGSSAAAKNRIRNGDCRIAQRGATITSPANGEYTLDGFKHILSGAGVITVTQDTASTPTGFDNALKVAVTTADASLAAGDVYAIEQDIEGYEVEDFLLGTASAVQVTLSFKVRSAKTGTHYVYLQNSAVNRSYPAAFTISSADTWEDHSVTLTLDTSGTWATGTGVGLRVGFTLAAGSTYHGTAETWNAANNVAASGVVNLMDSVSNTFYFTGVQLEVGSSATDFERRSFAHEFAISRRYFRVIRNGVGDVVSSTQVIMDCPHQGMRTVPSFSLTGVAKVLSVGTTFTQSSASVAINGASDKDGNRLSLTNFTGMTAGNSNVFMNEGGALWASAEV